MSFRRTPCCLPAIPWLFVALGGSACTGTIEADHAAIPGEPGSGSTARRPNGSAGPAGSPGSAGAVNSDPTGGIGMGPVGSTPGGGNPPGGPGVVGTEPSLPGAVVVPGPTALRLLTNQEYRNTIQDLLLLGAAPTDTLQPETRSNGYDNFSGVLTASATLVGQYDELVTRAVAQLDVTKFAPCAAAASEVACAVTFVKTFGKRAFRRPLTVVEEQQYKTIFDVGRTGGAYADGIKLLVDALLASPKLLYRTELGTPGPTPRRVLTPYEIASQLSYLLVASPPDAALMAAADASMLSPAQVETHARRLLQTPRARMNIRKFIMMWFGLGDISKLSKDPTTFPEFSDGLRAAIISETEQFIDAVLWDRDGTLSTLLTSPSSFINADLSKLYAVKNPVKGAALVKLDLDNTQRAGLLTHASVLATHSKANDSFPIARGKFVRKGLMCQALPPPPPGLSIVDPPPDPKRTTRERFAQHSVSPACAGCHTLIDPLGFGLETYDALGKFRESENGKPVDSAGMLTGTPDADGPYKGGVELAKKLASSSTTAGCAAIQATRWAFGRMESESDRMIAQAIADRLGKGNMNLRDLVIGITKTESFYVRTVQP